MTILSLSACLAGANAESTGSDRNAASPVELDAVEVVAVSESSAPVADAPGTATTIDASTIERQLARTIKDLIRYEPGVAVGNDPVRFGAAGFNIRGLDQNRVLIQVDGVRVPDAFSFGSFASSRRNMVDIDAVRSVEIRRGAGSALYGSDALGGAVSFITKDPKDYLDEVGRDAFASLKLGYFSVDDSFLQTATAAGRIGAWENLLLLTHVAGNEADNQGSNASLDFSRTAPNPQDTRGLNLLAKSLYRFSDDNVLRLTGEASVTDVRTDAIQLRGLSFTGRFTDDLITNDRQSRWRISLDQTLTKLGFSWFDQFTWRAYGQTSEAQQLTDERRTTLLDVKERVFRDFDYASETLGGELRWSKDFRISSSDHHLSYGFEGFRISTSEKRNGTTTLLATGETNNVVGPDTFPVRDFPLTTQRRAAGYFEDDIALLGGDLELIPGLRFDYYALDPRVDALFATANRSNPPPVAQETTEFSPKFGVLWRITDAITLHGQYAEGFRPPNFSESNVGFTNFAQGYATVPNANLQPETSFGGEFGLRMTRPGFTFDTTLFRNLYSGFLQSTVICDPSEVACPGGLLTFQTVNTPGEVQIQGAEFRGQIFLGHYFSRLDGLSLLGSLGYSEGENLATRRPISSINPLKGVLGLRFDAPSGRWGWETSLTLVDSKRLRDIDFDTAGSVFPTPGYGVLDLTAYYKVGDRATLHAGLFNLLDHTYFDWEDVRTRGRDPHAGLGPQADIRDRYSRPGINGSVTLTVRF